MEDFSLSIEVDLFAGVCDLQAGSEFDPPRMSAVCVGISHRSSAYLLRGQRRTRCASNAPEIALEHHRAGPAEHGSRVTLLRRANEIDSSVLATRAWELEDDKGLV